MLMGKPLGKLPPGRPIKRWDVNMKIDITVIGCEDVKWMELAQERVQWWALVLAVLNLRFVLPVKGKFSPVLD
jgi:hypothetical protein